MKRRGTSSAASAKIAAGLEDAIAYHRGTRKLTVYEVDLLVDSERRKRKAGTRLAPTSSSDGDRREDRA